MTNEVTAQKTTTPVVHDEIRAIDVKKIHNFRGYDAKRGVILSDEIIAAVKDDRMNTKRIISADIAATARVQNQNACLIQACERELRRRDLSEERRVELLNMMNEAVKASVAETVASQHLQERLLEHSHRLAWKILGFSALILLGGVGGAALLKAAA